MYVIVSYDIKDDRKRLKVMKRLLALGFSRLQKSVYVRRGSRGDAKDAFNATVKYLDDGDKLFIIVVSDKEFREAWAVEGKVG
ncbi:CRISPR-associated endonuclease Cas2 [Ignicoccus hospitalis]|uniref:CRISPR-associated endonuclease Cas2 n=1 Tax=Ignicoccus hospitalis TaxID=160233 RepID=UPI00069800C1|nr:CRISPR-associated endonuclease Cas2 [Ignicoccus hospitalis]HIH89835.1 CRISPR-associated endonuclease Cas2 [Desulfurococcaceae archaeon]